jgi:hypothetical protein
MTSSVAVIYVVYLTAYSGNLLPPFYIGSTSMGKIHAGYNGSVTSIAYGSIWKNERKDHRHLFRTVIISEHDSRQAALDAERRLHEMLDVVNSPLFINQAIAGVHPRNSGRGRKMSDKTRAALKAANTGRKQSEDAREKMKVAWESRRQTPVSEETRGKLSAAHKGRKRKPMSEETRKKISASTKRRPPPSPESLAKRSATQKARCSTPEARAKLSAAGKARWT